MKTLLWIDDDEKLIDDTTPVFRGNGFDILKAITPSQALRKLRHQRKLLDGVLLDVRLGGGENGLEMLEELSHIHPGIKVVVFTAFPDYSDQVDAKVAGALAYFEKVDKSIPLAPDKQATFFEALHRLFPDRTQTTVDKEQHRMKLSNDDVSLWIRGLFFLLAFIVVASIIAVIGRSISAWVLPLVLVTALLFYTIVCAFLLKTQPKYGITEKGFISLMKESLTLLPKLLSFKRAPKCSDDNTEKREPAEP